MAETPTCQHLTDIPADTAPGAGGGCEECIVEGTTWVKLRRCLSCGHIGCCDSSPGAHATKHHAATQHPVMQSAEPGESWRWCYLDEVMA